MFDYWGDGMIVNGLIEGAEVHRSFEGGPVQALSVDVKVVDVREAGGEVEASFVYQANYEKDVALLRMTGRLLVRAATPQEKTMVLDTWKSRHVLPAGFVEEVTNAAHYLCTINSPLATRIVDLAPPIVPMRLSFGQAPGAPANAPAPPMKSAPGAKAGGAATTVPSALKTNKTTASASKGKSR